MLVQRYLCSMVRITYHRLPWRRNFSTWYLRSTKLPTNLHSFNDMQRNHLLISDVIGKRYASKKAKNKKKGGKTSQVDTSVGDGVVDLNQCRDEMTRCVEKMKQELRMKYSTNLAIDTVDNFFVTMEGGKSLKLMEVAEVKQSDKEFHITPMLDSKNIEKHIMDSIESTGLKLNSRIHENIIKVVIPSASAEYKANLLKLSKSSAEKMKVALRKIRQQALTQAKRHKDEISKDKLRLIEKQIDILFEFSTQAIDNAFKEKSAELK